MRIGLCCSPNRAREAIRAGFDYVELPGYLLAIGERFVDLQVEACNVLFVGDLNLWIDTEACRDHLVSLIEGADNAGVGLLVFGSGNARRAEDGARSDEANQRFVEFCDWLQSIADRHDITIAPESLNRGETNVGNDYPEMARALAKKAVGHTADSFHIMKEARPGQTWDDLVPLRPDHVHLSDSGRGFTDPESLRPFVQRLKALGYTGRVSFEGAWDGSLTDLARSMRDLLDSA